MCETADWDPDTELKGTSLELEIGVSPEDSPLSTRP